MSYEVVVADTREEALEKSGYIVGEPCVVVDLLVSSAGPGRYTVIPVVSSLPKNQEVVSPSV